MGRILEFPSQQAKGLAYLDREIRKLLRSKGADEELVDFAADQLNRIYSRIKVSEQYRFTLHLPDGLDAREQAALQDEIEAGLEGVRQDNHRLVVELVAQLVLAEVKGFQLSRR